MNPDFSVVEAEFAQQVAALDQLVTTVEICGRMDPATPILIDGSHIPILPAEADNVMAAAAVVSLAAYFESFVKAQVEEYAKGVVFHYANLHADSQLQIVDAYWRTGLLGLGRIKPKDDPQWATKAATAANSLLRFPISGDETFADPSHLSDHDNNMRYEVIDQISKRLGIRKLGDALYGYGPLKSYLGSTNSTMFLTECKLRLFEFQDLRNTLVHRISQASGIGRTVYVGHRDFILLFAQAFTSTLTNKYPVFEARALTGNAKLTA